MESIWSFLPYLSAMAVLMCCSAFFSCSEAALFYVAREDRLSMQTGSAGQRAAANLLNAPERLLTAILFWNLMINIGYFALASIVGIRLNDTVGSTEGGFFALGSLLAIILLSEMLPKNIAVLRPRLAAGLLGVPLALSVRALDPIMPVVQMLNRASRRVLLPRFQAEPYLEVGDLERAIFLGTQDADLVQQEHTVLQNIVGFSEMQVEEIMRPRLRFEAFRPPVNLADLRGRLPPSGYVLITEIDGDDVAGAIPLAQLSDIPAEHLEHYAEKVIHVPWCATVATALEEMRRLQRNVASVINEHGETIGIVTLDDVLETLICEQADRSGPWKHRVAADAAGTETWTVNGSTSVRRLRKLWGLSLPETKNVTVTGVLQEQLQRLPQQGDTAEWGGLRLTVLQAPERGQLTVRLDRLPTLEGES